jgi:hypothetical protein
MELMKKCKNVTGKKKHLFVTINEGILKGEVSLYC